MHFDKKGNDNSEEKENNETMKISSTEKPILFCWNCGMSIKEPTQKMCEKCRAPLAHEIREEILSRENEHTGIKCWQCFGTTSGNICAICGAPLTKKGLDALKQYVSEPVDTMKLKSVSVVSPRDKELKPIEITLETINEVLSKYVEIIESEVIEGAGPRIVIKRPVEEKLTLAKLRGDPLFIEHNLKILIRNEQIAPGNKQIVIRFFYWKPDSIKERYQIKKIAWNILLFIATFVTVSIAGWYYLKTLYTEYFFTSKTALDVFLFTISLMAILTIHELGHYSISIGKKLDASLPYFIPIPPIPGIQTLGTFGAVIRQKEPFATRDDLFDIGIAGPLAGFLVTVPIFIIGLKLTYVIDQPIPMPDFDLVQAPTVLIADFLMYFGAYIGIIPYFDVTTQTIVQHPMLFAGYIGFILTGINLMPVSQLDGGHTSRAVFGEMPHRIISIILALLLIINPFTRFFGIFLLLMGMGGHPGAIDDVSPIEKSKYIIIAIGYIIAILCLPLPINLILSYF